jgi:hypothetical protein
MLTPTELLQVKNIDYDYWVELSEGPRLAADAPTRIRAGATAANGRYVLVRASGRARFPPLIIVTSGSTGPTNSYRFRARLSAQV